MNSNDLTKFLYVPFCFYWIRPASSCSLSWLSIKYGSYVHFMFVFCIFIGLLMQLDKLRPEFRSGLDALTKFVFERTRPKQVGATVMTGPILARITQSFLDAINKGAVPTITSSWQVPLFVELSFFPIPFVYARTISCKF